jgi:hypothetical protein
MTCTPLERHGAGAAVVVGAAVCCAAFEPVGLAVGFGLVPQLESTPTAMTSAAELGARNILPK